MNNYEQLIEYIINGEEDKARELFHNIVVSKSRDIYESLIDEQDLEEIGGNQVEELANQVSDDEEGMQEAEEDFDSEESEEDEDGMEQDGEMGDMEHGEEEGNVEDRVMDLEDALDELKAEFDALMAGEEAEEHDHPGIHDVGGPDSEMMGDEDMDEMSGMMEAKDEEEDEEEEDDEEEMSESKMSNKKDMKKDSRKMTEAEWIREYVEKIGEPYKGEFSNGESGNTVGAGGDKPALNSKSIVAGKNDMGGSTANIAKGGANQDPDGKAIEQPKNEYAKKRGELPGANKFKNTPGGDSGKTAYKEKASRSFGKGDSESGKTVGSDGSVPVNKKSEIGGKIR